MEVPIEIEMITENEIIIKEVKIEDVPTTRIEMTTIEGSSIQTIPVKLDQLSNAVIVDQVSNAVIVDQASINIGSHMEIVPSTSVAQASGGNLISIQGESNLMEVTEEVIENAQVITEDRMEEERILEANKENESVESNNVEKSNEVEETSNQEAENSGEKKEEDDTKSGDAMKYLYKCSDCTEVFYLQYEFTKHYQMKHVQVTCRLCSETFQSKMTLKDHLEKVHVTKHIITSQVACRKCSLGFENFDQLKEHLEASHQNEDTTCFQCDRKFSDIRYLSKHFHDNHGDQHEFFCRECNQALSLPSKVKTHEEIPHEALCNVCGKKFIDKSFLLNHIRDSHLKDKICDTCGRGFSDTMTLQEHELREHIVNKAHKCDYCWKTFQGKRKLEEHIVAVHYGKREHECKECGKCFAVKVTLDRHIKAVHENKPSKVKVKTEIFDNDDPEYTPLKKSPKTNGRTTFVNAHLDEASEDGSIHCNKCDKKYFTASALKRHFERVHKNCQMIKCGQCEQEFKGKFELKKHVDDIHGGAFTCPHCQNRYKFVSRLKYHLQRDHQKKCKDCDEVFVTKYLLEKHVKRVHKGKKNTVKKEESDDEAPEDENDPNYEEEDAEEGSKLGTRSRNFKFACDQCEDGRTRRFQSQALLNKHIKKKHK